MRLLVSSKNEFAFLESSNSINSFTNMVGINVKSFTELYIGYLCSAVTMLTQNIPDTFTEILRLCSEVCFTGIFYLFGGKINEERKYYFFKLV